MSLINDALKRAKQAQQENPPATPPLEFRPVEPGQQERRRTTLLVVGLSLVITMILGLGGVLFWFLTQSRPTPLTVSARVETPAPAAPIPAPDPIAKSTKEMVHETAEQLPDLGRPDTNRVLVAAVPAEAVPPPALKLQGIFFNPSNPSAVVNGKTVYLGERVNGFRLIAVSPVAVTLASATETNVLSLSGQ